VIRVSNGVVTALTSQKPYVAVPTTGYYNKVTNVLYYIVTNV